MYLDMKHTAMALLLAATAALSAYAQDDAPIALTEHAYTKKGEWEIRWFTDTNGKFVEVEMIRSYPNNTSFLMVWGLDLNAIDFYSPTEEILEAGKAEVTWYFHAPEPGEKMTSTAVIHPDNNGDPWLRISQPTDEPGAEDAVANAKSVTFESGKTKWQFDLSGSNEAYAAFLEIYHKKSASN